MYFKCLLTEWHLNMAEKTDIQVTIWILDRNSNGSTNHVCVLNSKYPTKTSRILMLPVFRRQYLDPHWRHLKVFYKFQAYTWSQVNTISEHNNTWSQRNLAFSYAWWTMFPTSQSGSMLPIMPFCPSTVSDNFFSCKKTKQTHVV